MKSCGTLRYRCGMAGDPDGRSRRVTRTSVLVGLAVLVPVILIAAAVALGGQPHAAVTATAGLKVAAVATTPAAPAPARPKPSLSAIPGGSGALVATILRRTNLLASPGGHVRIARLLTKTQFGSPEMLWVVSHVPGWLGVMTPDAGNNRVGWIAENATALSRVSWELKVSLGARRLTVLEGGKAVAHYTVAVGAPYAPTPTGRFAVTDRLLTGDPSGPYGCCILALSAHSPHAIQGWTGGTRIAIHSTPETSSIGEAASHGCVRVTLPEGRWLLDHIPLGTPTLISS
jgi:lipoprotein-anchoring transpeptidase ErfK/SrfK